MVVSAPTMTNRHPHSPLALALVPTLSLLLVCSPQAASAQTAQHDRSNEALPAQAVARLGSLNLRLPADPEELRWDAEARLLTATTRAGQNHSWSVDDGSAVASPTRQRSEPAQITALRNDPAMFVQTSLASQGHRAWLTWSLEDGRARLFGQSEAQPASDVASDVTADIADIAFEHELNLGGRLPLHACFGADATTVIVVGERASARDEYGSWVVCLDVASGAELWEVDLPGMTPSLAKMAPSSGGQPASVLVAGRDGRVARRLLLDGASLGEWRAHDCYVSALTVGHDGLVITGAVDGDLAAWKLAEPTPATGPELSLLAAVSEAPPAAIISWRRAAHIVAVSCVAQSSTLGLVASGGRDRRVRLWSRADGTLQAERPSHDTRLTQALATSDGGLAVSASWSGRLGLWTGDGRHRQWVNAHEGRVTGLALWERPGLALSAGRDGQLALWDLHADLEAITRQASPASIIALATTADGEHIATSGADGTLRLWSLIAGEADVPARLSLHGEVPIGGSAAFALAYLPGGDALAIGTNHVRLLDAQTGQDRWSTSMGAPVAALCVSRDGLFIAAALASRKVVVLSALDGSETWRWEGHPGRLTGVSFSPEVLMMVV
ncbi:MAG: WD40 repeat protein [Pseudohongiellaceae bacterium]|jgi:WD40 repeat protein